MAISFVDVTYNNAASTTSLNVDYPVNPGTPSAPQVGQLMLLGISYTVGTGSSDTSVSGWTAINSGSGTSGTHLYYKQGDGSSGSATITFSSGCRVSAAIALFSGTATSSLVDTSGANTDGGPSTTTATGNSLTATIANDMLFGCFGSVTSGSYFGEAGGMSAVIQIPGSSTGKLLTLNWELLSASGATGTRTCTCFDTMTGNASTYGAAVIVMAAIKAFNGPSIPTVTAPATAESITVGRTYSVTWTAATDPAIAQSSLQYNLDYSLNDGTSWTQIVALTSAGATSYSWNTSGITPSTQTKIRIRAYNGTDYSVTYFITGRFSLLADTAPLAPTNLHGEQPSGTTVTLFDIGVALTVRGTFNDPGDVMTAFDLDWGTDGITYGNTSTTTSSTYLKTYSASTFSAGTIYFRSRTKDNAATYGPYSYLTLTAAAAPAAPNITAPTAASPPASAIPTHTWTSAGQVKYRNRLVKAGVEVYNGGYISSTAQSIPAFYSYQNSTTYTWFLSVEDVNGLRSTEDSETFTASYTGPSTPTLTVTAFDASGYVELIIANPDSPLYNDIYRYLSTETTDDAIKIASRLPINALFQDFSPISGQGYKYFAQAVNSAGGFTNSVVSSTTTLTLSTLWLHIVSRTAAASSNAVSGQIVAVNNLAPGDYLQEHQSDRKKARGRRRPVTIIGQTTTRSIRYQVVLTDADELIGKLDTLEAIFDANATACVRDQRGNRIFGRVNRLPLSHMHTFSAVNIEAVEEDYTEAL